MTGLKRRLNLGALMPCVIAALSATNSSPVSAGEPDYDRYWPAWRGPLATGVAPQGRPPLKWSETENIRWKVELPGEGNNTPIVWGDRVFVQAAVRTERKGDAAAMPSAPPTPSPGGDAGRGRPAGAQRPENVYQFVILAYDRKTGREVWRHVAREEQPHEGAHQDGSLAPGSAVTDGSCLIANFGSRGLYGFDMAGKLKWERDLGDMRTRNGFGEGATPALHGDALVVTWDHEGDSFIVALDKNTGRELWRRDRDEATTWATPLVFPAKSGPQVVVPATNFVRGYDLTNGEEIWRCAGMTANCIPSPVADAATVYVCSGFRGSALLAIRPDEARGDISAGGAVAWKFNEGTPYVPSPLLYDDLLFFGNVNNAMLTCLAAKTGKVHFAKQRLEGTAGGMYASPVGAAGRVYVTARDGTTFVLKKGETFELLATNKLDDGVDASPAIVEDELYLRGNKHLYCIAE